MRRISTYLLTLPTAAILAACGGPAEPDSAQLPPGLEKDLELVKASSIELASAVGAGAAVVSGVESARPGTVKPGDRVRTPTAAAAARPQRTPVVRHATQTTRAPVVDAAARTVAPATDAPVAEAAAAAPESTPEPAPTAAEPAVYAGPQPTEDGAGATRPRDPGGWGGGGSDGVGSDGGWGGMGGVIIRGGSIGDGDNCEIRPRNMPNAGRGYPRGYPSGGTVYVPRAGGTGGAARAGGTTIRSRGGIGGGSASTNVGRTSTGSRSRGG